MCIYICLHRCEISQPSLNSFPQSSVNDFLDVSPQSCTRLGWGAAPADARLIERNSTIPTNKKQVAAAWNVELSPGIGGYQQKSQNMLDKVH